MEPLIEGDIGDKTGVAEAIRRFDIQAVIHFAAYAYVGK